MQNLIACRSGIFGEPADAFPVLKRHGVQGAEFSPTKETDYDALKRTADENGIVISTLGMPLNLDDEEGRAWYGDVITAAAKIGVDRMFCSVGSADGEAEETIRRFRDCLTHAADHGVTICMETHLPFGTNAKVALATVERVDAPNLRYNFDTANIYYYNEGLNAVDELKQCREIVGAVHLKDTHGEYHSMHFPILGQGVVDFAEVFRLLNDVDFYGPFTMELEGQGLEQHPGGREDFLRQSVEHLRGLGVMD